MQNSGIEKLNQATRMLAEIATIDDARNLIDLAEAARVYARQVELGLEAQNHAAEIKVRAQRRAGEILTDMDKAQGGRPTENPLLEERGFDDPPTYDELGINYKQAHQWQTIARIPEDNFEEMIAETKDSGSEITTAGIYREAKHLLSEAEQEELKQKVSNIAIPSGKFRTIVIDPPWDIQKIDREVRPNQVGFDYPTMSIEELFNYSIPADIADEDCHLFMWTTEKYLPHAFSILDCWGFKYVFTMVWHKSGGFQPYNLPQYNCEFVLYGRKGTPVFEDTKQFSTCFTGQRKEHSRKPDEFYQLINRVCPGPRIDIFSRESHDGFSQYGNETDKFS